VSRASIPSVEIVFKTMDAKQMGLVDFYFNKFYYNADISSSLTSDFYTVVLTRQKFWDTVKANKIDLELLFQIVFCINYLNTGAKDYFDKTLEENINKSVARFVAENIDIK